jgi:hypothetical protein
MRRTRPIGAWREEFLRLLGETGNAVRAAQQVRVSASWVHEVRRKDAGFAAEWKGALARFAEAAGPPPRGTVLRRGRNGVMQVQAAKERDWTPEKEDLFFAHFAQTLNVSASARAAGCTAGSAWTQRRTLAEFARRWEQAMDEGAVRMELKLMGLGGGCEDDASADARRAKAAAAAEAAARDTPFDPKLGLALLKWREARGGAWRGRRGRLTPRAPDLDALHEEVLRRLDALRRARGGPR